MMEINTLRTQNFRVLNIRKYYFMLYLNIGILLEKIINSKQCPSCKNDFQQFEY